VVCSINPWTFFTSLGLIDAASTRTTACSAFGDGIGMVPTANT
jgi:hypothetical protein